MHLLWLEQADLPASYVVLCAFVWRNLGFIGLNSQQKKKLFIYIPRNKRRRKRK